MMTISYSQHKINSKNDCPFSETDYSKFKFGDSLVAKKFANELFDGFIQKHYDLIMAHDEIVILPSPYLSIPTASNYLSHFFKLKMNEFLYRNNKKALAESKIHRNQTYTADYGNLSFEDRVKMISNDTYHIDGKYIKGKLCLFLDDIKITGSHEVTVKKIIEQYQVEGKFVFLYYAELMNKDIHPNIENYYNYFFVKDIRSLLIVMNNKSFVFNTRTVKYILKLEREDLLYLISNVKPKLLKQLFDLGISNNYHTIDEYKDNLKFINQSTTNKNKKNYGYQFTEGSTRNA
jgi:hypothetical protein